MSPTLREPKWTPAHIIGGDIVCEVTRLKQQPGKPLALFVGVPRPRLLDELQLLVHPRRARRRPSLFQDVSRKLELELADTKRFESGVVALRYRRDCQGS